MSNFYLGEIRMFAGNFAPRGWALCNGQLIAIAQNTALFSLLGTFYGGNGTSNFALPNLQSRMPKGQGQGPGMALYDIGEMGGEEAITILSTEYPAHTHPMVARAVAATAASPNNAYFAQATEGGRATVDSYGASANALSATATDTTVGGNQPHENMSPILCVNFIIATTGIFPARN